MRISDWSSDVCSSDLHFFQVRHFCRAMMAECVPPKLGNIDPQMLRTPILSVKAADFTKAVAREADGVPGFMQALRQRKVRLLVHGAMPPRERGQMRALGEIGRASCGERVGQNG